MSKFDRRQQKQMRRFDDVAVVEGYAEWGALSSAEWDLIDRYVPSGGSVLDLGCGTGRIAGALKDPTVSYLGIDNSRSMLEVARRKHPEHNFVEADFLDRESHFGVHDLVLAMHNTFSPLAPLWRVQLALRVAERALKDHGILVFSVHLAVPLLDEAVIRRGGPSRRGLFLAQVRGYAYVREQYHSYKVWQLRSRIDWMAKQLQVVGLRILECRFDWQVENFCDSVYYVAVRSQKAHASPERV